MHSDGHMALWAVSSGLSLAKSTPVRAYSLFGVGQNVSYVRRSILENFADFSTLCSGREIKRIVQGDIYISGLTVCNTYLDILV